MNKVEGVKVEGHRGTWYSIGSRKYQINGSKVEIHLFEHETYGDEAACVFATADGKLYMENVWNGWADWTEYFLKEQGYNRVFYPLKWDGVISI